MTKVIGIGLIGTAVTVITYSILGFSKMEVSLWPLFPVALFAFFAIENLIKKDYKSSLMSTLIGLMIANAIYDLLPISNSILIVAGILTRLNWAFFFQTTIMKKRDIKKKPEKSWLLHLSSTSSQINHIIG